MEGYVTSALDIKALGANNCCVASAIWDRGVSIEYVEQLWDCMEKGPVLIDADASNELFDLLCIVSTPAFQFRGDMVSGLGNSAW